MSIETSGNLSDLQGGDVITIADMTAMADFEDMVAATIEHSPTPMELDRWKGRIALKDLLRPPKFNGTIKNIELTVMDSPYADLEQAKRNNERFVGRGRSAGTRTSESSQALAEFYRGYNFRAEAVSSGRGVIGTIQSSLWYMPATRYTQHGKTVRNSRSGYLTYVQRAITKPNIETEAFYNLHKSSKRIGFDVLRASLRNPTIQPFNQ